MYWTRIFFQNVLLTAVELVAFYYAAQSVPHLARLSRRIWYAAGGALLLANFGFKPVKWYLYPAPDAAWLHSILYRVYVSSYFIIGGTALLCGTAVLVHFVYEHVRARFALLPPVSNGGTEVERGVPASKEERLPRRAFLAYGVAGAMGAATGFSGFAAATSDAKNVRIRHVRIPLRPEHKHLSGLRIAQITDIHVGPFLRGDELTRLMRQAMSAGADLIVHTGDHYNAEREYGEEGAEPLALLSAPHGLYAVPGNHDRYFGVEDFEENLSRGGFNVLRARSTEVAGIPELFIHGINDPEERHPGHFAEVKALGRTLDPAKFHLLLSHRPEAFDDAADAGFDLTLAGHTHGGQVRFGFPGGPNFSPVRLVHDYDWGLFEKRGKRLYVSSGLGYAGPPVRTLCPPEIAVIELVYENA